MMKKVISLYRLIIRKKQKKADFSAFFHTASSKDTQRLMENVVKMANEDQRAVFERYQGR